MLFVGEVSFGSSRDVFVLFLVHTLTLNLDTPTQDDRKILIATTIGNLCLLLLRVEEEDVPISMHDAILAKRLPCGKLYCCSLWQSYVYN